MTAFRITATRWGSGWLARYPGERCPGLPEFPTAAAAEAAAWDRYRTDLAGWYDEMGTLSPDPAAWTALRDAALAELATEQVELADGLADQHLVPGVAPVPLAAREIDALQRQRAERRGDAPLPSGGLFDDVARAQQDLFA